MRDLYTEFWLPLILNGKLKMEKFFEIKSDFNKAIKAFQKEHNCVQEDDNHERGTFASWPCLRKETAKKLAEQGLTIEQSPGGTHNDPTLITLISHDNGYFEQHEAPILKEKDRLKPREMGSHITYYKRYTYTALLGIATDDDKKNDLDKKSIDNPDIPLCPKCNAPMRKKTSRKDGTPFWGCSLYNETMCTGLIPID